jgi:hypothetical protein
VIAPLQPARDRAATVFDAAVFLANLLLVGPLTSLVSANEDVSPLFGGILLAGICAYGAGAWLKRRPLQTRMMGEPPWGGGAMLLFLILGTMHLGVFILAAKLGVDALPLPGAFAVAVGIVAGIMPTCLAVFAMLPLRHPPALDQPSMRVREAAADAGLWSGTVVLFALWEGAVVPTVAGKAGDSVVMAVVLVVLMTVPFAVFYLAPRMLFLVEDFRKRSAWARIALVTLPLAWRLVHG